MTSVLYEGVCALLGTGRLSSQKDEPVQIFIKSSMSMSIQIRNDEFVFEDDSQSICNIAQQFITHINCPDVSYQTCHKESL